VTQTGRVIADLSGLADRAEKGPLQPNNAIDKVLLDGAARDMSVNRAVIIRVVNKLVLLRKKKFVIHLRACNMEDDVLVDAYRRAFGARMVTFHGCRLLFMQIKPEQMKPQFKVTDFSETGNEPRRRIRIFTDPIGLVPTLLIEITDVDLHTNVKSIAIIERPMLPPHVQEWATMLIRQWKGSASEFVLPVMWQNDERTHHAPLEPGWSLKLKFVPSIPAL
jgi:hypothetical protein